MQDKRRFGLGKVVLFSLLTTIGLFSSSLSESAQALGLPPILLSISVAPAADSLAVGQTAQYIATGHYSDLSTKNLTSSVTWASSNTSAATVSTGGLATGVATGVSTISATDPSTKVAGTALLTVTPAVLLSISVAPVADSIGVGQTEQFTATGLYSDLSTKDLTSSVTWASSNTSAATVSTGGLATGVATGVSTISATDPSTKVAGTALLTVTPAVLLSISVAPAADSLAVGQTDQYTATGLYSDLSTKDLTSSVTWASSNTSAATVSTGGLATGVGNRGEHYFGHRSVDQGRRHGPAHRHSGGPALHFGSASGRLSAVT